MSRGVDLTSLLKDIPGTELLAMVLEGPLPIVDAELLAWVAGTDVMAQAELGKMLSSEVPTAGETEVRMLHQKLELVRLERLRSQIDAQFKHPGLDPHTMLELLEEIAVLTRMVEEARRAVKQASRVHES